MWCERVEVRGSETRGQLCTWQVLRGEVTLPTGASAVLTVMTRSPLVSEHSWSMQLTGQLGVG